MKMTAAKKATFCAALVRGQTPDGAAKAIGVSRAAAYNWKARDAAFAAAWDQARERKIEEVENILYKKAVEGEPWAVCFFLKGHRPELFNRRQVIALGGDLDNPIGIKRSGEINSKVHFYIPTNGRDRPEEVPDEHTIEGTVEDAA